METATIALEAELSTNVWTDLAADVEQGSLNFQYGIPQTGPLDLVASTGTLHAELNNSQANSGAKEGYYTAGHANQRSGFDEGTQLRVKITYGGTSYYKWVGRISRPTPIAGVHGPRRVELEAVDWMDQAAQQRISQLAIQTSKRVDQVLPAIFADMPIAPRATSYAIGVETLSRVFDTDNDERMSPMAVIQKMMRNEYGLGYLMGDTTGGETFRFDSRHTRALNTSSIVTLSSTMQDLQIEYSREAVKNLIKVRIYPKKVDAAATTVLYEAQQKFSINAGQSLTLILAYRDPTTARPISGSDVVYPLVADTDYKFGSSEGTANDLNGSLGISATIGGNSTRVVLTNNAAVTGYVNLLKLRGKGIYAYDPQTLESKDTTSINKRGELTLNVDLEQHDSQVKGQAFADYLKNRCHVPCKVPRSVRFLANRSSTLMTAALAGEISSRITLQESMTALNSDYFINAVHFEIAAGGLIWCEWTVVPADSMALFIWNTSYWNVDTYWAF